MAFVFFAFNNQRGASQRGEGVLQDLQVPVNVVVHIVVLNTCPHQPLLDRSAGSVCYFGSLWENIGKLGAALHQVPVLPNNALNFLRW